MHIGSCKDRGFRLVVIGGMCNSLPQALSRTTEQKGNGDMVWHQLWMREPDPSPTICVAIAKSLYVPGSFFYTSQTNTVILTFKTSPERLERRLRGWVLLLLQRTWVSFIAPAFPSSQPPVTSGPEGSYGFWHPKGIYPHMHVPPLTHIHNFKNLQKKSPEWTRKMAQWGLESGSPASAYKIWTGVVVPL